MIDVKDIFRSLSVKKYVFILLEYIPALFLIFYLNLALAPIIVASQNIESLAGEMTSGEEPMSAITSPLGIGLESYMLLTLIPTLIFILMLSIILTFGVDPLLRAFMFRIAGKEIELKKDFSYAKKKYWDMFGASVLMFFIYAVPTVAVIFLSFSFKPSLLVHDTLTAVTMGTVNVFLYMVNPLIVIKGLKPSHAIKKSIDSFLERKKDILTVFLLITLLSISVTYLIQRFAFGIDPQLGLLVKSDFAVMLSYLSASLSVLVVQGIISSFFDYMHINARVKLLKESKSSLQRAQGA